MKSSGVNLKDSEEWQFVKQVGKWKYVTNGNLTVRYNDEDFLLDLDEIEDIEFEDVFHNDHPDYCDAFVSSATYKGREMLPDELDILNNEYTDFVYEKLMNHIF